MPTDGSVEMLRHTLATLCYRGAKTLRGTGEGFATFRAAPGTRSPAEILAHVCDLLDWALCLADGRHEFHETAASGWEEGADRFFRVARALDERLASGRPLGYQAGKIFQGPIADALTHVGQIALLRRLAGCQIRGENYFRANIVAGCVGSDQPAPVREFD